MIIARPATATHGFDCSTKVSRAQAQQLWTLGYRWCGRYVPLPGVNPAQDIDDRELDMLLAFGFEVILVQHVRFPGWDPAAHSGFDDAAVAVAHAKGAGFPQHAHVFLDLEGISGTAVATEAYAETWASTIRYGGFSAGVYCGFDDPLDAQGLWLLHGVDCYWSDDGHRVVANRGCAILQGVEHVIAGLGLDGDTIAPDLLGGTPIVAAWQSQPDEPA